MDEALTLDVETGPAGQEEITPYVQFLSLAYETVRLEVSSNEVLTGAYRLSPASEQSLAELGLEPPARGWDEDPAEDSVNWFTDSTRDDVERLAVLAVRALRDVFGVPHPAFLAGQQPNLDLLDGDLIRFAESPEELRAFVDAALEPLVAGLPEHDEDDDIPVVAGTALIWVGVRPDHALVELFSWVVIDITDHTGALRAVNRLNEEAAFLRFWVSGDRIAAGASLSGDPFVPHHFRAALRHMARFVNDVDEPLAAKLGGRPWFASEPSVDDGDVDELHPALQTIIQLDADPEQTVDAALVAKICSHDRDLILELITQSSRQEIAWRQGHEEALLASDPDEAEAAAHELEAWEGTTRLLRKALRLVVAQDAESDSD